MRISKTVTLIFFLITLVLLSACEQNTGTSQNNTARVSFDPNVHDKELGKYIIHVNALTTDQLPAEVARGYKISRSKNRAMLNISIREKQGDGEKPVTASVKITAKNLSSQLKNVKLREIKDKDPIAIYYIGELPVSNEETIIFDMDIIPTGTSEPVLLSYKQQFYTQ